MNDGVAGVVSALAADDDVRLAGEDVDDFAFAFIAPLRADQNCVRHELKIGQKISRRIRQDAVGTCRRTIRSEQAAASAFGNTF